MASSSVAICSNALRLVGDKGITAFTDDSDAARLANALYQDTVDELLQEHKWNFATMRAELGEVQNSPLWGWDHQYQLPQSPFCLQVLDSNLDSEEPWRIETYECGSAAYRVLLTDADCVAISYIARMTDVSRFPPLFVSALEYRLAAKFAYGLTRNATLVAEMERKADERVQKAKSRDGQEGRPLQRFLSTVLTDVRRGSGRPDPEKL